ncbi:helix-turn-helix domain-containing protein [Streptomyces humidus]|uniref:helix-turn-helix domain-containing protein n=1 Tax=Streptomyces humidus TaxID=52259 RepID=UPI003D9F327D
MGVRRMNPHPPLTPGTSEAVMPQALRKQYEAGATVDELVAASGLSYGTVLNRLHDAGTVMRSSWQARRMRQNPQARQASRGPPAHPVRAARRNAHRTRRSGGRVEARCPAPADRGRRHRAHHPADPADTRGSPGRRTVQGRAVPARRVRGRCHGAGTRLLERNNAVHQLVRARPDYLQGDDTLFRSRDERIRFAQLLQLGCDATIDESVWIPQEPAPKPSVNGLVEGLWELPQ